MHEEANESEEKHDESHSKRRDVGPDALLLGVATLHESTDISDSEQEDDRGEANGSVKLCIGQGLECVDDDLVRGLASVDLRKTKKNRHLCRHDGDASTSDEGRDGDIGDELDDPTKTEQTEEQKDCTRHQTQSVGDFFVGVFSGAGAVDMADDLTDKEGADGCCLRCVSAEGLS